MNGVAGFVALAAMVLTCFSGVPALAQCTEQQKITASDPVKADRFGSSVSVSGDTAIVGVPGADCFANPSDCCFRSDMSGCGDPDIEACVCANRPSCCDSQWDNLCVEYVDRDDCGICGFNCGAAYIYRFDGSEWVEEQMLTGSDVTTNDYFGRSVSISGNTAVVGAGWNACTSGRSPGCGAVYVYRFNGTSWVEEQKLFSPGSWWLDNFGNSVSVNGDTALIGAYWDSCASGTEYCGSAYVFRYDGASWVVEQKLTASDATYLATFGESVSLSGDTAVVGVAFDGCAAGSHCGSAYVFRRFNGTNWVQEQKLTASVAAVGEHFGYSVSVDGDTAVVVAVLDDCAADDFCGLAYVFRFNGISWVEQQKLSASDAAAFNEIWSSVSVSGDTAVVGKPGSFSFPASHTIGSAYVFRFNGTFWVLDQKLTTSDANEDDGFGRSVSVNGDTIFVGASEEDCAAGLACGAAYVFDLADLPGLGPADSDCDGDVDLEDLASFQAQFAGDLFDFASVLVELTGPQ